MTEPSCNDYATLYLIIVTPCHYCTCVAMAHNVYYVN